MIYSVERAAYSLAVLAAQAYPLVACLTSVLKCAWHNNAARRTPPFFNFRSAIVLERSNETLICPATIAYLCKGYVLKILAHRGWWETPDEKNSVRAFRRAFESGFGVETDVRDQNGTLKIAHDMPVGDGILNFSDFLSIYKEYKQAGTIALNIKADGLHKLVKQSLEAAGVEDLFCFDMAVPDSIDYIKQGFITYTRHSELEPVPPYYKAAHGVWIDAFHDDWVDLSVIEGHLAAGKYVALVSPELHGRDHKTAWGAWAGLKGPNLAICTDMPHLAADHWG